MCDLTCLLEKEADHNCGLPCEGLDSAVVTCGSFVAGSVYDVNNASITCTVETTSTTSTTTKVSSAYVIQPVHIVYFSFTGAAFAIVIIVIIFRTSKRREHNFAGTFPTHFHSNQEALTVNYSPHDTLNYPYDSLVRGIPFSHPSDPLPMTTSELRSHTNSRRRRSCEADDDHWCDHGGRGVNGNTSSGCNFYFSTIAEDDEGREEEEDAGRGLKGMMKGKECYPTRPISSCSSDGAYAYVDYNA
nr:uncharacterized protein LOC129261276 [Lytechinus pictus]